MIEPADLTPEAVLAPFEQQVLGAVAAVRAADIFTGHLAIDMFMQRDDADTAAAALYDLYAARTDFEVKVGNFLETLS